MWRFLIAIAVAIGLGFLSLKFSNWVLKGSVGFVGDLFALFVAVVGFWILYKFLENKVDDYKEDKAHKDEVEAAYQRGLEDGRREAVQDDLQKMEDQNPSGGN